MLVEVWDRRIVDEAGPEQALCASCVRGLGRINSPVLSWSAPDGPADLIARKQGRQRQRTYYYTVCT